MTEQITSFQDVVAMGRLARDLAEPVSFSTTSDRVVSWARTLSGASAAALLEYRTSHRPKLLAVTGAPWAGELAAALGTPDSAMWRDGDVVIDDFRTERRCPKTSELVTALTPARSALTVPTALPDRFDGILILAGDQPSHFNSEIRRVVGVFADHAVVALGAAAQYARAEQMAAALRTNRSIGMAMGILMTTRLVTEEEAFDQLRHASQHANCKMHILAEHVKLTGALPDTPAAMSAPVRSGPRSRRA